MSDYNKTILTNDGLALVAKANKGTTKFTITRAATSAEKLADKSIAELQQLTELPSLMQYGVINDVADAAQDSNIVIGTELVFNNKDLANSYNINAIGLFAKEEGSTKEILYALTTANTPESMPDFNNKVLFKFNMTMFVAIAQADNVTVNVNDNGVVTKLELASKLDSLEKKLQVEIDNAGQIKQISVNKGTPVGPDASGKVNLDIPKPDLSIYETKTDANLAHTNLQTALDKKASTSDLSKYVQSIGGNKPDSVTGDVPIVTKTYYNVAIEPNTFIKPGVFKLVNCSYLYVNIAGFAKTDLLNGYLIVNKGKTDNDVFQNLITDSNNVVKINMRKVNPKDYVYPDFRRLTDDSDYSQLVNNIFPIAFEHPNRFYAKNEIVDIDKLTENGIYHFMDSKVISSIKTDALDGMPKTTDGTTMCGYLFVMKHDDYNREQVLLLNGGAKDVVVATRSISGTNSWKACFRRLLNIDDFNALWNMINTVDKKELVHQCNDLDSGIAYSKAHPNVFVATS